MRIEITPVGKTVTQVQSGIIFLNSINMPKKATITDFQAVENNQQEYNCSVCKDTGVVYFVLESSFWGKKKVKTQEPQTCYSCQPKT